MQGCAEVLEPHGSQLVIGQTAYSYEGDGDDPHRAGDAAGGDPDSIVIELEESRHFLRELGVPVTET